MEKNSLWGADPEVAAVYTTGNGELAVLPPVYFREKLSHPYLENGRHPIFIEDGGVMVHEDGVAFELSVPPASEWTEVYDSIQHGYHLINEQILKLYPKHVRPNVEILPTVKYEWERWVNESAAFNDCNIFGCDRDWDAFEMDDSDVEISVEQEANILDVRTHPLRYFGGHIHRSGSLFFEVEPVLTIKCLAMTAGVAAIAYSDQPELEKLRTYLYGKPGRFRPQTYKDGTIGIEYRTLSNTWTKSKEIAGQVFSWFDIGVKELLEKGLGLELLDELEMPTTNTILQADQHQAFQILERIKEKI